MINLTRIAAYASTAAPRRPALKLLRDGVKLAADVWLPEAPAGADGEVAGLGSAVIF
jgi:predicted acyl esterase